MTATKHPSYSLAWIQRISELDGASWDALALPLSTPIFEWEWLRQMELSESIAPETGWLPCHLTVRSGHRLVAAAPLYIKSHSAGEFVFDYLWADVARQLGISYYPKMVGMSPATPSPGYRFLIAPGEDEAHLTALMIGEIDRFCSRNRISGCSFLFVDPGWRNRLADHGFIAWKHQNFAWRNPGFQDFEDYLGLFNKNQRHNIRRERKAMEKQGIIIRSFSGQEAPESFFPLMYTLYERTNDQFGPWAAKYLTRNFFLGLAQAYRHRLLFTAAFKTDEPQRPLGMSFLLTKGDQLIGRYWGSFQKLNALHFNVCYYSPIEWAIAHRIRSFDPGIGSSHKLRRGFEAIANYSLHRFYDQRLGLIMERHIDEINQQVSQQIRFLNNRLPWAKNHSPGEGIQNR